MRKNICKRCILPETEGHISIDKNGICNVCRERESINLREVEVTKKCGDLNELKTKIIALKSPQSKYDCAVSVSGGNDSLMALYIAKKILGLNVLGIVVDNGYVLSEMFCNISNASEILDVDILIVKTNIIKKVFRECLLSKKKIYYCRVCHMMLDKIVKDQCIKNNINIVMGGYTEGQQYIKNNELFWIYEISDKNLQDIISKSDLPDEWKEMFKDPMHYVFKNYGNIKQISPYKYYKWDEKEIVKILERELKFKKSEKSWPINSSNCMFNHLAQYKAEKDFGYSQHQTELSDLVRAGTMSRERALEIINTPFSDELMTKALKKLNLLNEDL